MATVEVRLSWDAVLRDAHDRYAATTLDVVRARLSNDLGPVLVVPPGTPTT